MILSTTDSLFKSNWPTNIKNLQAVFHQAENN